MHNLDNLLPDSLLVTFFQDLNIEVLLETCLQDPKFYKIIVEHKIMQNTCFITFFGKLLKRISANEFELYWTEKNNLFSQLNEISQKFPRTFEKLMLDYRSDCGNYKETVQFILHQINRTFYKFLIVMKNLKSKENLMDLLAPDLEVFEYKKDEEFNKIWSKLTTENTDGSPIRLKMKEVIFCLFTVYQENIKLNTEVINTKKFDPMEISEEYLAAVSTRKSSYLMPLF